MSKQSFLVSLIPQTPNEFIDIFSDYLGPRWKGVFHFYGGCPEFCVNGISLLLRHPVLKLDTKPI